MIHIQNNTHLCHVMLVCLFICNSVAALVLQYIEKCLMHMFGSKISNVTRSNVNKLHRYMFYYVCMNERQIINVNTVTN